MGNDCVKANNEDIGMNKYAQKAVGSNANEITDDLLEASLPNDSLKQKVGLTFECLNLPNMDVHSLTDAFVVVYLV
jgi:hypothetical protein